MIRFFSAVLLALTLSAGASVAFAQGQGDENRSDSGTQNSQDGQAQANANANSDPGNSANAPGQQAQADSSGQATLQSSSSAQSNSSGSGANTTGPYDPSGVGQPSGNGNSDDNNGNRPCAGCVGSADTKNPRGQLPGGQDSNRGYECDSNEGVGKTNPAHSGCQQNRNGGNGGNGGQDQQAGVQAQAQPPPPAPAPERAGDVEGVAAPQGELESEPGERPEANPIGRVGRQLAFTGLGLAWMLFVGALLTAIGGYMRQRTDVRQKEPTQV